MLLICAEVYKRRQQSDRTDHKTAEGPRAFCQQSEFVRAHLGIQNAAPDPGDIYFNWPERTEAAGGAISCKKIPIAPGVGTRLKQHRDPKETDLFDHHIFKKQRQQPNLRLQFLNLDHLRLRAPESIGKRYIRHDQRGHQPDLEVHLAGQTQFASSILFCGIAGDVSVSAVVVDRLEVFGADGEPGDVVVRLQTL